MVYVIYAFAFLAVTLLVAAGYYLFFPQPGPIQQRLDDLGATDRPVALKQAPVDIGVLPGGFDRFMETLLTRVGRFFGSSKASEKLRQRLRKAGYYDDWAVTAYTGAELMAGLIIPLFGIVALSLVHIPVGRFLASIPILALVGFMMPSIHLTARISKRKAKLQKALPDALDLMVSCVEAGLSLNAALVRVAREIRRVHPELAREFGITNLEIRAGKVREDALRNLGKRSGVKDLQSFAAMLIQTERFGTSISQALRVFSDSMRTKRRQRAEKAAAETTIKLLFPLVFFIFPFLFVVLLGPGLIRFIESLLPVMNG